MFGFGIAFVYNIAKSTEDIKAMTLDDLDNQIVDLRCGYTEKACLDRDRLELRTGDLKVLTLRLLNVGSSAGQFRVKVRKGIYVDPENNKVSPLDAGYSNLIDVLPEERTETINANDAASLGIGFQRPNGGVAKGTYVFDVVIEQKNAAGSFVEYEPVHKVYVSAP
ncbi:MAG: hypothetical protein Q7S65_02060 [Nanoarchaeota archaeon]|nr:hypothetical protein [Nanoarchaeota archaeon]